MTHVDWIYPYSPGYDEARKNWDAQFDIFPDIIAKAYTMRGVRQALKYILEKKQKFSVRGGRHCFEPWSLSKGIVLDLGELNHVKVKKNKCVPTAKIGAGGQLGNIYEELLKHGYYIPAGTRPTVGIGGQGMNGGIGYSTRKSGLLTDSIVKYKLLLANGVIITVSKDEHRGLFWALRGAGAGNYGVVLEYEVKLHPVQDVTVFTYTYDIDTEEDLSKSIEVIQWMQGITVKDVNLTCQSVISKTSVNLTGQLFGTPEELEVMLSTLPEPQTKDIQYGSFADAIAYFSAPTVRESAKAKSRFFSKPMQFETIKNMISFVKYTDLPEGARLSIGFQQLAEKAGGSILWNDSPYWVNWSLRWVQNDKCCQPRTCGGVDIDLKMLEESYLETLQDPATMKYSYMGMMDVDAFRWKLAYYGSGKHLRKLLSIKKHYDPCNKFKYPQGLSAV